MIFKPFLKNLLLLIAIAATAGPAYSQSCSPYKAGGIIWPIPGDLVISTGTVTPGGLTEIDGDCAVGYGGSWIAAPCGSSTTITIGSLAAANPQILNTPASGLYSIGTTSVGVEVNSAPAMQWETLASGVDYVNVFPGKSGTAPLITVGGVTVNQGLKITSTGTGALNLNSLLLSSTGTISNSTWNGAPISYIYGGTGNTTAPTNGQLLIGTGSGYSLATITAGSNITVSNSSGGITISATTTALSAVELGTSTTANPLVSGFPTTGFYTASGNKPAVENNGVEAMQWETLSSGTDYVDITPGKSGTPAKIASTGALNITSSGAQTLQLNGVAYPASVSANSAMASTATGLISEAVSTLLDNGVGSTNGAILARTTTWQPLVGTVTGDVLTWNGSAWAQAVPSSGMTLLATINANASAGVVFGSSFITNAYNKYVVEFDGVFGSAEASMFLTVSVNNGSTYLGTSYDYGGSHQNFNSSTTINGVANNDANQFDLLLGTSYSSSSSNASQGTIKFSSPSATAQHVFTWDVLGNEFESATTLSQIKGSGVQEGTAAINTIKIAPSSGTLSGNFHLYGLSGQ